MEVNFSLCKHGACGLSITGFEKENYQYLDEFSDDYGKFTYLDTVSVNVMIPLNAKEEEGKYEYTIKEHTAHDLIDQTVMEFPKDGLYRIVHAIIPTKQWKDQYTGDSYETIYYYDDGQFYKNDGEQVDIEEVIGCNQNLTTVFSDSQLTFSSCQLQECYYKYSNKFLEDYCASGKCYNKSSVEFDILWIGMHVMRYLLDLGRLYEAQYVLEKLTGCTGICYQKNKINIKGNGCGC